MDFRMEKISYLLLVFMVATMAYFIYQGAAGMELAFVDHLKFIGFVILTTFVLVAFCSIPVVLICYFIKKIPDIDYSITLAAGVTLVGIISELI